MGILSKFFFKSSKPKPKRPEEDLLLTPIPNHPSTESIETSDKIQGIIVVKWIQENLPPLAWNRISIRLFRQFQQDGINIAHLNDQIVFNKEQINRIDHCINSLFNKHLPNNFTKSV